MDLDSGRPSIKLYGEDAALLEPFLRDFERKCAAGGATEEAELRVFAIRRLAAQWLGSANGTAELPTLDDASPDIHPDEQTTKEAAMVLDISDRGVRKACEAGRLKGRKVGGTWRVAVVSVTAELERRREEKGA